MMKGTQASSTSSLRRGIVLLGLGALLLGASPASGQVLYQQTFDNTSTSSKTLSAFGSSWAAYETVSATDVSAIASTGTNDYAAVANTAGNPAAPNGYLFVAGPGTIGQSYSLVTTFTGGQALSNVATGSTISWAMGNSKNTSSVRLMIQIGGDGTAGSGTWYASSGAPYVDTATHTTGTFTSGTSDVAYAVNFTTLASAWDVLTLNPGSQMTLGTNPTSDLASSTITGIGFYILDSGGASTRLDNLTVTAVPEPSAAALFGFGALGLGLLFQAGRRACC